MFGNTSKGKASLRRTSVNKRRCFGFMSDISTKLSPKEAREFEYGLLDSTCYETERQEYYKSLTSIRDLRVIEFMGKFKPIEEKITKLGELRRQFFQLQGTLNRLLKSCQTYQELAKSETTCIRKPSSTDEEPFALKIKKDMKEMEQSWNQVFVEGSLRRLHDVLVITGLENHEVDFEFSIQKWVMMAESCFSPPEKRTGCCLRMTACLV